MQEINIVWLKRDLRVSDHAPFAAAMSAAEKFLVIYCFEPSLSCHYDFHVRHWRFIFQSIKDLRNRGVEVFSFHLEAIDVFKRLQGLYTIKKVFSHQESGVEITYNRDKLIKGYFRSEGIAWHEFQSNGVVRGLKDKRSWDREWIRYVMNEELSCNLNFSKMISLNIPWYEENRGGALPEDVLLADPNFQHGGESQAWDRLESFCDKSLRDSEERYVFSSLSPYISWGNLTIRQIYQRVLKHKNNFGASKHVNQFLVRLKWHCKMIQSFEMDPSIETKNLNRAFDQIRTRIDKKKLKAWKKGQTGLPLVDAAMRCVVQTGYLSFRQRTLVASFLTHHLWQPWQEGAKFLARQFLDYEPGIHFTQFQMQACSTGINSVRIHNPVKQSFEKDEDAAFILTWVPELQNLPLSLVHEPWKITKAEEQTYNFKIGRDYPHPIVSHQEAAKKAQEVLEKTRSSSTAVRNTKKIFKRHR